MELGFRYVETDVHVTTDGELVAFHDEHLDRVTDRVGAIADLPWSDVRRALVDGREPIPRLVDVLEEWPDLRINIDPKHDAAVEPLAEVLERTGSLDRVCVGAFSDRRLAALHDRLGDRLCSSMGPRAVAALRLGPRPRAGRASCVQVPPRHGHVTIVTPGFLDRAHRLGLHVHVWTIDEPAEMHRLLDVGVDGIMTDRPHVLRQVLEARGQWSSPAP